MIPEGVASDLQAYFLGAKYVFVLAFVLFVLALKRWPHPFLLAACGFFVTVTLAIVLQTLLRSPPPVVE